ncbi:hypothetical protein [Streptomyces sp. KR80]|uniref:hypothetical protein n=1 Tax=Streptomyces sp. KR80 TaxID=3457426 RepID=UPI003FD2314D
MADGRVAPPDLTEAVAMSARTQRWSTPPQQASYQVRLPWWALALPVIAFVALLLLLGPGDAHAATGSPSGVGQVLSWIQEVLHHTSP